MLSCITDLSTITKQADNNAFAYIGKMHNFLEASSMTTFSAGQWGLRLVS